MNLCGSCLGSAIKGRLTKGICYTGKDVYSMYATLFGDTISKTLVLVPLVWNSPCNFKKVI